jgi:peptidoglycan hydrolase-like protein with peptidoglycan-binding domain
VPYGWWRVARAESEPFFIFGEEDFAWEEPGAPAAAAAVAIPLVPPVPRVRRRRQTRTFAGDIRRLSEAVGLSPFGLGLVLLAVVVAAVGIRVLVTGDRGAEIAKREPPRALAPAKKPGTSPTSPIEAPSRAQTFEPDDHGAGVRDLQTALSALGFYEQGADGAFGPGTGAAVVEFQSARGLEADGVAGPLTAEALVDLAAERATVDAQAAEVGLAAALQAARVPEADAARYRRVLADSLSVLPRLPPGRAATIGLVLHDVAANAAIYDQPRALALFAMLEANVRFLAEHALPASKKDITGDDGVFYRYFLAHGFQFHPLGNFAHLNRLVRTDARAEVRRLATALAARGVRVGKRTTWEYYFPFGGPPSWTSGFAQAAGAQALARAGAMLGDSRVSAQARSAFRAIPAEFTMQLGGGLWIREYSHSDMAILNAQLQSLLSISDYAEITGDAAAAHVAASMATAARALLPRFDTGCWSRYSLDGSDAALGYHTYHVSLLKKLAHKTGDPVWTSAATRWDGYLRAGQPAAGSCA